MVKSNLTIEGVDNSKCAPDKEKVSDTTCFDKEALIKISGSYNKKNPEDKITISGNINNMWKQIQKKLDDKCGVDETCWLNQDFLKKEQIKLNDYFKPLAPLGQYQWLTTDDIYSVMHQYENKYYPDFKFIGPLPMDFLDLTGQDELFLQQLKLDKLQNKYLGVIFNLDSSKKPGSHWVSLFINNEDLGIYFFDSYGDKNQIKNQYKMNYINSYGKEMKQQSQIPVPIEIQKFVHRLLKNSPNYVFKVNTIQHQYANSECGIYSMMFLLKSLSMPFEKITQEIVRDEVVNQLRNGKLFRK